MVLNKQFSNDFFADCIVDSYFSSADTYNAICPATMVSSLDMFPVLDVTDFFARLLPPPVNIIMRYYSSFQIYYC